MSRKKQTIGTVGALGAAAVGVVALVATTGPARGSKPEPKKPKPKPKPRRGKRSVRRLTVSTLDASMTVRESPEQLLAQSRKRGDADVTLEELTAARLIVSEHGRGSPAEMAAILDAELNRANVKGLSLTEHLTSAGTYGKQGGRHGRGKKRPASTRADPYRKHLEIARAVFSGELRGISQGAVRFFDPVSQMASHRKWRRGESDRRHCHPAVILERWSFDKDWNRNGPPCALRDKPGRRLQEWVGPIDGIDPLRLMLMRPAEAGPEHERRYQEARRLILERYPLPRTA